MDNTLISITGSDHNDLDTIFLEERGHYREIRVRRSSASQNSRERGGEGGGISACFKWQSFHFLLSDKQYASKTFHKTYTSIIC